VLSNEPLLLVISLGFYEIFCRYAVLHQSSELSSSISATVGNTRKYLYTYKSILIILNIRIHGEGKNLNNSSSSILNGTSGVNITYLTIPRQFLLARDLQHRPNASSTLACPSKAYLVEDVYEA
jgi:hypothetical protein